MDGGAGEWLGSHCHPLSLCIVISVSSELERTFLDHVHCRIQFIGLNECRLIWVIAVNLVQDGKRMMLEILVVDGQRDGWPCRESTCSCWVLVLCVLAYMQHTYMQHMDSWCLQKLKEGIRLSGTGVLGSWEPLSLCWELNLGLL